MFDYTVEVIFQNQSINNPSTYKVDDRINLNVGDKVVVPVLEDDIFKVAEVVRLPKNKKLKEGIKYRWVVQRVDLDIYEECLSDDIYEERLSDGKGESRL